MQPCGDRRKAVTGDRRQRPPRAVALSRLAPAVLLSSLALALRDPAAARALFACNGGFAATDADHSVWQSPAPAGIFRPR